MTLRVSTLVFAILLSAAARGVDDQGEPPMRMLLPGFTVRELPVELTSLNNVEYAADGRLFAGGYDGRLHVLRDTDGDGLEDRVDTFVDATSANYPLGIAVRDGTPYFVLDEEVVRFIDSDGDGVPDRRETVAENFDNPALAELPYLHHRRVDSSLGLALGPDGAIYVTMGNAGFSNPYWHDGVPAGGDILHNPPGEPQYDPKKRRGCLLRITPDGKVEQLASGLRYVVSLQFNNEGDLFCTDQEGATWCPNGNPFDELLHLQEGRHYGFPPRHPKWLPNVIDEPSVWDFAPQHQSTCGFRFNGPAPGRGRFGPEFWAGDALVTGESRGKLWRTALAKTAAGYVASTQLIGVTSLLAVDCAISPDGDLVICCHTGPPDWGNGPNGAGRLLKISFDEPSTPQPVFAWPRSATDTVVAFDRTVTPADWTDAAQHTWIESGRYVGAADRLETIRPGYAVVQMQQRQLRTTIPAISSGVTDDAHSLVIETARRTAAVNYALALPGGIDVAHDLTGVAAEWRGPDGDRWEGWLPHPDLAAARQFTRGSATHEELWQRLQSSGTLRLRGQADLWQMLIPATQPGSTLGYEPEPETVTLTFCSDVALTLNAEGADVERISERESKVTVNGPQESRWLPLEIELTTPAARLDVSFHTKRDSRGRPLPTRRFLMPFATPAPPDIESREIPQLAGGDREAGRALFLGKAACATCHRLRGEGVQVGADLGNLIHRDYESVLRDILEPSATINPDAVGYTVVLNSGKALNGVRMNETADTLELAVAGGEVHRIDKSDIEAITPMGESLMPGGLDDLLTAEEIRDLMAYLLTEPGN